MSSRLILFLLLVCACLEGSAQVQFKGYPIRNYSPKEYNASPQCWSAIQDHRGIMYFGTSTYILEYDGSSFRRILVRKSAPIRSLGIDKRGRIYAGSVGEFGYLESDANGKTSFRSLLSLVPEKNRGFSDIWKIHVIGDSIFFQSNEFIFLYDQKKISTIVHKFPFASISFSVKGEFFVRVKSKGLHKLTRNGLEMIQGTEEFANEAVFGIIKRPGTNDHLLILSGTKGFYDYDEKAQAVTRVECAADSIMRNCAALGMGWLNDSVIVVHSRRGLILLTPDLEIKDVVNRASGLMDEAISAYYTDSNGQTWLPLNNGLAKVSLGSPFYFYNEKNGLDGVLEAVARIGSYLYVASSSGLFYAILPDSSFSKPYLNNNLYFHRVREITVEGWGFLKQGQELYVSTSDGVYKLEKGKGRRLTSVYTNSLLQSSSFNWMYAAQKDGLAIYKKEKQGFVPHLFFPFPGDDIIQIYEEKRKSGPDYLWLSTRFKGLIRFSIGEEVDPAYRRFDTSNGIPQGNVHFVKAHDRMYFFTSNSGFEYVETLDKGGRNDNCFRISEGLESVGIFDQKYWELKASSQFTRNEMDEVSIFSKSLSYVADEPGNHSWLCVDDHLVRFDGNSPGNRKKKFPVFIRSIESKDSLLYDGGDFSFPGISEAADVNSSLKLSYDQNQLTVSFAAAWFDQESAIKYRWRLIGFDTTWSYWNSLNSKEYTNLHEGEYLLEVEAVNRYGMKGTPATFRFTIAPPWYRTGFAYSFYLLGFAGIIVGTVRLSVRQLRRAKVRLEEMVSERTAEVLNQKDLLEQKNQLLEHAYKDISDSISYASRIQQAILPVESDLRRSFSEHFVLFLPRDVVSGDFYWHATAGDLCFLAVADCTGHGVPGAFMSMIGNTLLNEIVLSKQVKEPGLILKNLDNGVKNALKQLSGETDSNDGMDIAIISYDKRSGVLSYAGANRSLFILENGNLQEIKPDKKPVGGGYHPVGDYTTHVITVQNGSMCYLFSDGYADQFGGNDGKKFMMKRMKAVLSDIASLSAQEQCNRLGQEFRMWKDDHAQVDDVLVIGLRI